MVEQFRCSLSRSKLNSFVWRVSLHTENCTSGRSDFDAESKGGDGPLTF